MQNRSNNISEIDKLIMQSKAKNAFNVNALKTFLPFIFFSVAMIATYAIVKVDIMNRPVPRPASQEQTKSPMEGKPAPAFTLPTLDGKIAKLSDYRGKILFVNIWATWCEPCKDEMPSMQALYNQLKGPHFEMLAISVDKDGPKVIKPFVEEFALTFPILLDPKSETYNDYKGTGVPETFIISHGGIVMHHIIGPMDWSLPEVVKLMKRYIEVATKDAERK